MKANPPSIVRCKLFWTESKKACPTKLEILGSNKAPHNIRGTDNGSDVVLTGSEGASPFV